MNLIWKRFRTARRVLAILAVVYILTLIVMSAGCHPDQGMTWISVRVSENPVLVRKTMDADRVIFSAEYAGRIVSMTMMGDERAALFAASVKPGDWVVVRVYTSDLGKGKTEFNAYGFRRMMPSETQPTTQETEQ